MQRLMPTNPPNAIAAVEYVELLEKFDVKFDKRYLFKELK